METAFDRVTSALVACGSDRKGSNWICPAHDDSKASMTVTKGHEGVVLYCHAGCDTKSIVNTLGLSMSDLFDKTDPRPIAFYDYKDADGKVLFRKTRFEPKDFRISHPNGNGWEPKIGDATPVLYKLPELKEAILKGDTVYIVEGEKDVDTLAAKGIAATCNYEGAGKWLPGYAQVFRDARVIIIADRDKPGYDHAKQVKDSLAGIAYSVRIMQSALPNPKADVTDHFAAGYTLDELVPINGAFKPVSLNSLLSFGVKAPTFLADGMLYRGGLHCIAGAPDSGKTTIALWWTCKMLAQGQRVAFFDEEGGQEIIAEKLISLGALPRDMDNLVYVPFPGKTWEDSDVEALTEFLADNRPDMVLFDSSAAFLARAGLDENSAPAVTNFWARVLMPLARDLNSAVLVIDHDTKSSEQSRYARGSGAKLAALDVQFKIEIVTPFSRQQSGELKFHVSKDRRGWLYRDWRVKMVTQNKVLIPSFIKASFEDQDTWNSWSPMKQDVYAALDDGGWVTIKMISDAVTKACGRSHTRDNINKMLLELKDEDAVQQQDTGAGQRSWWRRNPS